MHNNDCLTYVKWLAAQAIETQADHIIFMGDWFETRSAINIHTLHLAHQAMTILNDLNLPIFMIVGNHDCYFRNSRNVHSLVQYSEFSNVTVIDNITHEPSIGDGGTLLVPYAFGDEYEQMKNYLHLKTWFGHFEFQGFVITGQNHTMTSGPRPADYIGPAIFSGHFHKRQTIGNITYIGNTFPMDYSDAGDIARGCMTYDHATDAIEFFDWEACPKYQRVYLSELLDKGPENVLWEHARVKCYVDRALDYEQSMLLKDALIDEFHLREFVMEEVVDLNEVARGDSQVVISEEDQLEDVDHMVVRLLEGIQTEVISPTKLISIYNSLEVRS